MFTSSRVAAVLAAALSIAVNSNAGAARPQPVAEDAARVTPAWTPLGVARQQVTVVVQVSGATVAEQQGDAGRRLSNAEKGGAKAQLRGQQDALRPSIESLGGTVLAQYQAAYN